MDGGKKGKKVQKKQIEDLENFPAEDDPETKSKPAEPKKTRELIFQDNTTQQSWRTQNSEVISSRLNLIKEEQHEYVDERPNTPDEQQLHLDQGMKKRKLSIEIDSVKSIGEIEEDDDEVMPESSEDGEKLSSGYSMDESDE